MNVDNYKDSKKRLIIATVVFVAFVWLVRDFTPPRPAAPAPPVIATVAAAPAPTATPMLEVEPGSSEQWNDDDIADASKPESTPTIREHMDEILDAPSPKAALRAWADWMDEVDQMDDDQDE